MDNANLSYRRVAAQRLKEKTYTLCLACRNPRTLAHAGILVALLVGYIFSLLDAVPNFILVVSSLDETVVVPLGMFLARTSIPGEDFARCRARTREVMRGGEKPVHRATARAVAAIWVPLRTLGGVSALRTARRVGT